ncbi:MAG: hypothetical protein ACQESR_15260 [Planctomycetota bacterium]
MGRAYAGILGPVAFGVVVTRSLLEGGNVESALRAAPLALFAFAAIGYAIGLIAEKTIVGAVETEFHAKLQAEETAETGATTGTNNTGGADQPA